MKVDVVFHNDDFVVFEPQESSQLILLGSYSTADLSAFGLDIYSIYGSEDLVLNREKYAEYYSNLPSNVKELVIEGGCHAHFGDYGPQDGNGVPTITAEAQIETSVNFILYKLNMFVQGGIL